jgi:hypothetical protein
VEALDTLPGRSNYYLSAGRAAWRANVPNYARVGYRTVFPGIDLVVYGKTQQVEYDWVVAPGADPAAIRFSFTGATHLRIDTNGDLALDTQAIGPLCCSTYIGVAVSGSPFQNLPPLPGGLAVNPLTGAAYVTGATSGQNFPLILINRASHHGRRDGGFRGGTRRQRIAAEIHADRGQQRRCGHVDRARFRRRLVLYLTGNTQSTNFPTTAGAYSTMSVTAANKHISRQAQLTTIYSTYLGPGTSPVVRSDLPGNAYVAASTTYPSWTTTSGAAQSQCAGSTCADVVLLKVNPGGSQLLYATHFGGSGTETLGGLALDQSGNAYLSGATTSPDLPTTTGAFQTKIKTPQSAPAITAFAAKLDSTAKLIYATYLGGTGQDRGYGIAVDSAGNAYLGGQTSSADFPLSNAFKKACITTSVRLTVSPGKRLTERLTVPPQAS